MKVGATHVFDPNVEGDGIIERVRSLSAGPTNRAWSGGRDSGGRRSGAGADLVVEAAGAEFVRPKLEAGPDPTGILPMQQAYQMANAGGHVITTGLVRGTIALPAFSVCHRRHHPLRRPGRRRQPDARHPAIRRDARQRSLRRQSAGHTRRRRSRTCSMRTRKSRIERLSPRS